MRCGASIEGLAGCAAGKPPEMKVDVGGCAGVGLSSGGGGTLRGAGGAALYVSSWSSSSRGEARLGENGSFEGGDERPY